MGTNLKNFCAIRKRPFGAYGEKKIRMRSFEKNKPMHRITYPCG